MIQERSLAIRIFEWLSLPETLKLIGRVFAEWSRLELRALQRIRAILFFYRRHRILERGMRGFLYFQTIQKLHIFLN